MPTQGSSGLLRDTKPNSNYTSKSSSTKAYTTCIVGVDGIGILRDGIEVRQRDAGSRDARLEVSVHEATQAEWSLTVAKSFGIIHYNSTLGILTSDTMHGNKEAMW